LNKTCFNMGYHNEHHDFAGVPWNNLPKLRKLAPDYYDSLASYRSWTAVLLKFIFDPSMTTYSRVVRTGRDPASRRSRPARAPAPAAAKRSHRKRAADAATLDAPAPTEA
jgi:sphingolipid delta-4 desaturase